MLVVVVVVVVRVFGTRLKTLAVAVIVVVRLVVVFHTSLQEPLILGNQEGHQLR